MTPTRETIARAIVADLKAHSSAYVSAGYVLADVRIDGDCDLLSAADAVLRALDAAGLAVVPKEADDAMIWGGCAEIAHSHGGECKRCPPLIDTPYGPGTQACRLEAADIYRAMIAAAPDVVE